MGQRIHAPGNRPAKELVISVTVYQPLIIERLVEHKMAGRIPEIFGPVVLELEECARKTRPHLIAPFNEQVEQAVRLTVEAYMNRVHP